MNIYQETLDKIIFLYQKYSEVHRASTQPFHLEKVKSIVKNYQYQVDDLLIREPLIEHSGSLPIVATTIYPNLKESNVDLGRALIMLAIHDIGELVTGDENVFTKDYNNKEKEEALKLLPPFFHEIYLEMEERKSNTACFAKAVDKMTPDIIDLMAPAKVTIERYQKQVGKSVKEIVSTIKEFKHPYMLWSDFMTKLHLEILERIDQKLKFFLLFKS